MKVGILDIICIIIIFQLTIFSIFLFVKRPAKLSNYLLGIQLISQAGGILNGFCFIQYEYFYNDFPDVFFIGLPFMFLWGPTFYLYVKSAAYSDFKFKYRHIIHFIPFLIILLCLSISFFPLNTNDKRSLLGNPDYFIFRYNLFIDVFIRAHVLFYIILSLRVLLFVREKIRESYASISKTNYSWIKFIVYGFTMAFVLSFPFLIYVNIFRSGYQLITFITILIYSTYFNVIFFKAWYQPNIFSGIEETVKYKASRLTKEEANSWINKLENFVERNKPYLNSELTLNQLAESIQIQPRVLSQIINENYNQNFQDYINRLRVEESKKFLIDPTNKKTILEILYEVGFNTKSAYNIAFKKATGITPTEYKKKYRQGFLGGE